MIGNVTPRVLIFEDGADALTVLVQALSARELELEFASSTGELDALAARIDPDILIFDAGLVARQDPHLPFRLRERHPGLVLIATARRTELPVRTESLPGRVDHILVKPFDVRAIQAAIEAAEGERRAHIPGSSIVPPATAFPRKEEILNSITRVTDTLRTLKAEQTQREKADNDRARVLESSVAELTRELARRSELVNALRRELETMGKVVSTREEERDQWRREAANERARKEGLEAMIHEINAALDLVSLPGTAGAGIAHRGIGVAGHLAGVGASTFDPAGLLPSRVDARMIDENRVLADRLRRAEATFDQIVEALVAFVDGAQGRSLESVFDKILAAVIAYKES